MNHIELHQPDRNVLPYDGTVLYVGEIIPSQQAHTYFNELLDAISWQHDGAIIYGKRIVTKRKVAWYADEPFSYTYSKVTKHALAWHPILLELKEMVERRTGEIFNACLLNLYHNGNEGMAWHSDGERDLRENGVVSRDCKLNCVIA